jgi:hypothetical protein
MYRCKSLSIVLSPLNINFNFAILQKHLFANTFRNRIHSLKTGERNIKDRTEHRSLLEKASIHLNIKEMSDWYKISQKDLRSLGNGLSKKYHNSPSRLLAEVYPEHDWLPWKFDKCPQKYWDNVNNKRKFLDWAGKQLNVKEMGDWYKVTFKVMNKEISIEISRI